MPPKRMTANPVAPLRYRPGKAPEQEDVESESESEESDSEASPPPPTARPAAPKVTSFPKLSTDLASRQAQSTAPRRAPDVDEDGFVTASDSSDGSGSEDEDEDSSEEESDYDSDSSDAGPRFAPPTIVKKTARPAAPAPAAIDDEAARKAKADAMLQAQLEREAAERAAGRKDWDDDLGDADEVDDTDGLDPEAEHAAWRLRELLRLKRARDVLEAAEREKAEIERREALTAEEREREDAVHIAAQKEALANRGKMGFMQKYFHKGAFFQGDEGDPDREAKERDVMGRTFQDDADRELLPQYMQIRDMTKLGRKGRTRYKDLRSEDTGTFGGDMGREYGGGYGRPRDRFAEGAAGATGANDVAVGERRRRDDDAGRDEKRPRFDR